MKAIFLALFYLFSMALLSGQLSASAPGPEGTQRPANEVLAVAAADALLVFDRLFTQSTTVVSPDYLSRVSDPSSRFYPVYREFAQGRINRAELVRRLPHVAMLGDSLARNFYISSVPSMFWRARTEERKNWFLDTDARPESIYSLFERLSAITPLVVSEFSGDGARVASRQTREDLPRQLVHTHNLSGQVDLLLRREWFPDLTLVWIGHNNSDWVSAVSPVDREHPQKRLQELAQQFGHDYTDSIRPLIERAKLQKAKTAIVFFGLADFGTFFETRKRLAELNAQNHDIYPYIRATCKSYPSFQPAYQKNTTTFSLMLDDAMRRTVADFNRELKDYPNVRLQYSDAFSNMKIRAEIVHPKDAWHLSRTGHNVVAQTAFTALSPSLRFLGWPRKK